MICTNASCKNHGHDQPQSRFCPECGGALAEAPKPPVQPAASLPPGYNFPAIGKSIVGGDQNISNTSIYHQDETKSVRKCAVSGRQAEVTRGYVCPSCSLWVHEDHFDRVLMRCESCRLAASNHAQKQFEEKVTYFLSDGQISREELMELRVLGGQLGLSNVDQDSVVAKLKQRLTLNVPRGLSMLDKTKLKAAMRQLIATAEFDDVALANTWSTLKVLHRSHPANVEIVTLIVVGLAQALQGRGSVRQYRELEEVLQHAEAFSADSPHKYLVQAIYYRLAGHPSAAGTNPEGSEFQVHATERHHEAVAQLETLYPDSPECRAVQLSTLLEDYYTNGGDGTTLAEIKEFIIASTEQLGTRDIEQALKLVRLNYDEGKDFGVERLPELGSEPLAQLYYDTLICSSASASPEALFLQAEKIPDTKIEEKLRLYCVAASKGYAVAQRRLGYCYNTGTGVPQDYAEAAKWYRKAADQGDARGQYNLGVCYANGTGVPQDHAEAVKWYRKAADQGDARGQYNLGRCYADGTGVPQDHAEAAKLCRRAADQGDSNAQNNLGIFYHNGTGVPQDYAEAAKWYRKAADQGHAAAQANIGILYDNGTGVTQDYAEALKWYRKAADQGDACALTNIGILYHNGAGVPQDHAEAVKWYRKAADHGHAAAQANIGSLYFNGTGVPQDYAEALKWYRKAADQGNTPAQYNIGIYYEYGYSVPKDIIEAVKWYRKAADQGYDHAQYKLGVCYENSVGLPTDEEEAVKWYRKAADQGNAEAQYQLGECYLNNFGVPADGEKAAIWYRKAADQENAEAQWSLGLLYESGIGVPEDVEEALKWYRKAADLGHKSAKESLKKAKL